MINICIALCITFLILGVLVGYWAACVDLEDEIKAYEENCSFQLKQCMEKLEHLKDEDIFDGTKI